MMTADEERVRGWWGEKREDTPTESKRRAVLKELDTLLNTPTVMERAIREEFRLNAKDVYLFCDWETARECAAHSPTKKPCRRLHFCIIADHRTQMSRGNCSFLDHCFNRSYCKAIHYDVNQRDLQRISKQLQHKKEVAKKRPDVGVRLDLSVFQTFPAQWIQCDVRYIDFKALGKFSVILADPPWRINMELPYGTMSDEEMRRLPVSQLQDHGVIFLWVTSRATRLGHELFRLWGYEHVNDLVWVKINQLQSLVRTGRTGHWMNHAKEHCMIGIKGNPSGIYPGMDCDVLVSEVRDTSRKPDELYGLIERLSPGTPKIELFGRRHNVQKNWLTLGDQLPGVHLEDEGLIQRFKQRYPYTPEETLSLLLHNQHPRGPASPSSTQDTSQSPEHLRRERRQPSSRDAQHGDRRVEARRRSADRSRARGTRHDTREHSREARSRDRRTSETRRSQARRRSRERSPLRPRPREAISKNRGNSVDTGRGARPRTAREAHTADHGPRGGAYRERGEAGRRSRVRSRRGLSEDRAGGAGSRARSTSADRRAGPSSTSSVVPGRSGDADRRKPDAEATAERIAQLRAALRAGFGPKNLAVSLGNVGYWKKDRHGKDIFIRIVVSHTEAENIMTRWNALQDELNSLLRSPNAQQPDSPTRGHRRREERRDPSPGRSLPPRAHSRDSSDSRDADDRDRRYRYGRDGRNGRRGGTIASRNEGKRSDGPKAIVSTGDGDAKPTPTMSAQDLRNLWG